VLAQSESLVRSSRVHELHLATALQVLQVLQGGEHPDKTITYDGSMDG
jgi:hypothetical protein